MIKSKNVNSAFDIKGIKIINGENKDNENSIIVEDKTEKLELNGNIDIYEDEKILETWLESIKLFIGF